MLGPDDERRHRPPAGGDQASWEESWSFELALPDASFGAFLRLALHPGGPAWFWAAVVGTERPLVAVRDHEVPPPRSGLEVRTSGLWSDLVCETPLEHWTVGLEAFALAYDDPYEAWRDERGERVALGFDLEWEVDGDAGPPTVAGGEGYSQPCRVSGDVLVGAERLAVDGAGFRYHEWGPRDWWGSARSWAAGHLSDGTSLSGTSSDVELVPVAAAPFLIPGRGASPGRLARHLCRFRAPVGLSGAGWSERLLAPGEAGPNAGP